MYLILATLWSSLDSPLSMPWKTWHCVVHAGSYFSFQHVYSIFWSEPSLLSRCVILDVTTSRVLRRIEYYAVPCFHNFADRSQWSCYITGLETHVFFHRPSLVTIDTNRSPSFLMVCPLAAEYAFPFIGPFLSLACGHQFLGSTDSAAPESTMIG